MLAYEILCISANCCTDRRNGIKKTGMPDALALLNVEDVRHLERLAWTVYDGILMVGPQPKLLGDRPWCTVLAGLQQHIYRGHNDAAHCPPQMLGSWDCQEQVEALHHAGCLSSYKVGRDGHPGPGGGPEVGHYATPRCQLRGLGMDIHVAHPLTRPRDVTMEQLHPLYTFEVLLPCGCIPQCLHHTQSGFGSQHSRPCPLQSLW